MTVRFEEQFSQNLRFMKVCLLLTVIAGHVSAFWLPKLSDLSASVIADWPVIVAKGLGAFGREAAIGFVLFSGFFTAHHFQDEGADGKNGAARSASVRTARHRLSGLYPQYLFTLVFTLAIDTAGLTLFRSFYENQTAFVFDPTLHGSPVQVAGNAFFLEPLFVSSLGTNGPLWTIGFLVQFYLVFTLCHALGGGAPVKWAGALATAALAMVMGATEWATFYLVWLAGASIRYCVPQPKGLLPAVIALATALMLFVASKVAPLLVAAGLVALAGYLTLIAASWFSVGKRIMRSRLLNWFADATFSVYLLHMPILFFVSAAIQGHVSGYSQGISWFSVNLVLAVLLAAAFHAVMQAILRQFRLIRARRAIANSGMPIQW